MSNYQESCQLRMDEIAAVLSLAGRKSVVGFQTEDMRDLTPDKVWNGCCRLLRDEMMTQIDGKFRLCRELVDVMQPICQAGTVLALTPASDLLPQMLYYAADRITAMERTSYGRYVLTPMGPEDLFRDLQERMQIEYTEEPPPDEAELEIDVLQNDSREKLLVSAEFVLEAVDGATGVRKNWLRLVRQGMDQWLQWTWEGALCCEALTAQLLQQRLQLLLRGETA